MGEWCSCSHLHFVDCANLWLAGLIDSFAEGHQYVGLVEFLHPPSSDLPELPDGALQGFAVDPSTEPVLYELIGDRYSGITVPADHWPVRGIRTCLVRLQGTRHIVPCDLRPPDRAASDVSDPIAQDVLGLGNHRHVPTNLAGPHHVRYANRHLPDAQCRQPGSSRTG